MASDGAAAPLPFKNDGSFMETFLKMQQQQQQQQQQQDGKFKGPVEPQLPAQPRPEQQGAAPAEPSTSGRDDQPQPEGQPFLSSAAFEGAKPGYVFTTGEQGTGYYRDVGLDELLRLQREQAKSKPAVLKNNNPFLKAVAKRGVELPAAGADAKKAKAGDPSSDSSKPAYLKEMDRYRALACSDDRKDRPLVK